MGCRGIWCLETKWDMNFQEELEAGQGQGSRRNKISRSRFPGGRELGTGTAGLLDSESCSHSMSGLLPCLMWPELWHL